MVEVGVPLPKFFQTQTSSEYLHPLSMLFLCSHFSHVCVLCFYVHLHMFSRFRSFVPFLSARVDYGSVTTTIVKIIASIVVIAILVVATTTLVVLTILATTSIVTLGVVVPPVI